MAACYHNDVNDVTALVYRSLQGGVTAQSGVSYMSHYILNRISAPYNLHASLYLP